MPMQNVSATGLAARALQARVAGEITPGTAQTAREGCQMACREMEKEGGEPQSFALDVTDDRRGRIKGKATVKSFDVRS